MSAPFPRLAFALLLAAVPALPAAESEVTSKTFQLNYEGTVKVRATTGVIRVNVWDRDEARVDLIKHCDSPDLLEFMRVNFESAFNSLSIITEIATATGAAGEVVDAGVVDIGLTIPRHASIEIEATSANIRLESVRGPVSVKTTNGPVYALNLAGNVTIESTHGPLRAAFDVVRDEQIILVKNIHGEIRVQLPGAVAAWLKARTVHGGLKSDFAASLEDDPENARVINVALNGGGAHVTCENQNGNIILQRRQ